MAKYKPEDDTLSVEKLEKFVSDYTAGKISRHLLTEDIPDDWDAKPVKVLVGENFDEVVNTSGKAVFVKFCKLFGVYITSYLTSYRDFCIEGTCVIICSLDHVVTTRALVIIVK